MSPLSSEVVSVLMAMERLRKQISRRGNVAFLITVGTDGRPHSVSVEVSWLDDELVMGAGNVSLANAKERPLVSLLWPTKQSKSYSLIVNGTVTSATGTGTGDNRITVTPTRAVLHRSIEPASVSAGDRSCASVYSS